MKADKIRGMDLARSSGRRESQEQMFRLRFQMGMGQTDGLKKLREPAQGSRAHLLHRS